LGRVSGGHSDDGRDLGSDPRNVGRMSSPRSLADDLRRRDDDSLARLLTLRPDLLHPVPADFTALTARAAAGPAVSRCLDSLNALELHVLRVAAEETAEGGLSLDALVARSAAALPAEAIDACRRAATELVDRALLWGGDDALRAVSSIGDLVAGLPAPAWPLPDALIGDSVDQEATDSQAGLHARESLALLRDMLDEWSVRPPGVLRTGGLSLRDFAGVRTLLHADWPRAALTIELAHAARLVADDEEESPHWVPTEHYDTWSAMTPAEQWAELVDAWLTLPRLPSRSTEKSKLLLADNDRRPIPGMRRDILDLLAELPVGTASTQDQILTVLDFRRPRRAGLLREQVVAATLQEAADLGLVGGGALSTAARIMLSTTATDATERRARITHVTDALARTMPADVDHVLIQADLTIVAPGPLTTTIGRTLGLMADVESRGHATVYRIGESSVRRALDAGWDAEGIHAFLQDVSRTPVPQPLTYLVDDIARRHGAVRVGSALAYLRSDAADVLSALVEDRRLRSLGLHRIAETVVIAQAPSSEVISGLRNAGYAPAAESPDGVIVVRRPEDRRVRTPRRTATRSGRTAEQALVTAAVRTLRAGDRASAPRKNTVAGPAAAAVPRQQSSAIVAALRHSLDDTSSVWIGYADTDGTVVEQIIDPIRLTAGVLTAFDHRTDGVRTFAVSRITGVADIEGA